MESTFMDQADPNGQPGRWNGWRIGRIFGLVLVAGLVLAGWYLAGRSLPAPVSTQRAAPVVEIATSAPAVAEVAPAPLSSVAAKTQAPAPVVLVQSGGDN